MSIVVLQTIFEPFGQLSKVVLFTKHGVFQALVEFVEVRSAAQALRALNGKNIYAGCCTLNLTFSRLKDLVVNFNNEKSRDFVNDNLPVGPPTLRGGPNSYNDDDGHGHRGRGRQGMGGNRHRNNNRNNNRRHQNDGFQQQKQRHHNDRGADHQGGDDADTQRGDDDTAGTTPVLYTTGIAEGVSPDMLFKLFGCYGDVLRVKLMYMEKQAALIQFRSASEARCALTFLDGCPLRGSPLRLTESKHQTITRTDDVRSKSYFNHPLHRFAHSGSRNYLNIAVPSSTLHLSGLLGSAGARPSEAQSELDSIRAKLEPHGTVLSIVHFPNDTRMALVEMESLEAAVEALVMCHGMELAPGSLLRISFSKSRTPSNQHGDE